MHKWAYYSIRNEIIDALTYKIYGSISYLNRTIYEL